MCKTGRHYALVELSAARSGCFFVNKLQWNKVTEHVCRRTSALMHKPVLQCNSTWLSSFIEKGDFKNIRKENDFLWHSLTMFLICARGSAVVKVYGATQQVGGDVSGFLAPLKLVLQPSQRHPHRGIHTEAPTWRHPPWVSTRGKTSCYCFQFSLCKLLQTPRVSNRQIWPLSLLYEFRENKQRALLVFEFTMITTSHQKNRCVFLWCVYKWNRWIKKCGDEFLNFASLFLLLWSGQLHTICTVTCITEDIIPLVT